MTDPQQDLFSDTSFGEDVFHDECGVFGIFGHADAGALSVLGLHALQHRGQEAAGIVTFSKGQFIAERHAGLVGDVFGRNSPAARNLTGDFAVGHVRYSTAGGSNSATSSPSSPTWRAAAWPSPIMAISPTPMPCAPNWWRRARFSKAPPTP